MDTDIQTCIKERFIYDPKQGDLIYRDGKLKGRVAGTPNGKGYRSIGYKNKLYLQHKLVWAYYYGYILDMIDHIDQNKANNCIENLRVATKSLNEANTGIRKNNTSGYKGVAYHKAAKKWRAYLQCKHIGLFNTAEEAAIAYDKKAFEIYQEFAHLNILTYEDLIKENR